MKNKQRKKGIEKRGHFYFLIGDRFSTLIFYAHLSVLLTALKLRIWTVAQSLQTLMETNGRLLLTVKS